jgi:uncharacterized protein (TIGR01777 family)
MSRESATFLVSGASGMLGSALRRALAARGVPVLQLVRHPPDSPTQLQWNPAATPAIISPEALEGFTAAVHFSGANLAAHRWTVPYKREMILSRVQSTHALATALAGLSSPPQVLLTASAIGFYGSRGDELLDEASAPGAGFLADLCQEWEAAAQPAAQAGIRLVYLRFGVVLGPGPGALARLLPLFRLGLGGPLGSGQQWMSWISLADAIAAILFAAQTPTLAGPVNVTAPAPVTNAEFTRFLAAAVHRPAFFTAPAAALHLALGPIADEALLVSVRAFPSRLTSAGFRFTHPTVDQALAAALAPPL